MKILLTKDMMDNNIIRHKMTSKQIIEFLNYKHSKGEIMPYIEVESTTGAIKQFTFDAWVWSGFMYKCDDIEMIIKY